MILREKQLSALHLKLCIRTIKKEKRACLYRQSNYKKIQEVDSQVITIDQQIKDDTNALLEMNKRIMADSLKLERESGLQIKKLISGYTLAMADKTKNVHETLKQNVSLKKFLSSDH
jgi:glycerol-3-phosphate cytidylyltransferase-like family protein